MFWSIAFTGQISITGPLCKLLFHGYNNNIFFNLQVHSCYHCNFCFYIHYFHCFDTFFKFRNIWLIFFCNCALLKSLSLLIFIPDLYWLLAGLLHYNKQRCTNHPLAHRELSHSPNWAWPVFDRGSIFYLNLVTFPV